MSKRSFGSIFRERRPDGTLLPNYYVSWTDVQGLRHQRAAGPTRESAEFLLDALLGERLLAQGRRRTTPRGAVDLARGAALPFATHVPEIWHAWHATLAQGTLRGRRGALGRWTERLGRRPVSSISLADVQACVRKMREDGLAASTVKTEVQVLSAAFKTLSRELRVPLPEGNPSHGVALPAVDVNPRPHIAPEKAERFLAACPESIRGPVTLLIDCGLRPAELLRLTWGEVSFELGGGVQSAGGSGTGAGAMRRGAVRLANTKTHKTRAIPLTLRAREVLREARDASPDAQAHERVFAIREKPLRVAFREAARASGLPDLIPYHLRHAFACTMADKGIPVSVIRDLLGHANLATTNAYLRSLPDRASEAAIDALEQAHAVPPA